MKTCLKRPGVLGSSNPKKKVSFHPDVSNEHKLPSEDSGSSDESDADDDRPRPISYFAMIRDDPRRLSEAPLPFQTKALSMLAVRRNGLVYSQLRAEFRIQEFVDAALGSTGFAFGLLEPIFQTESNEMKAVRTTPKVYRFLPVKTEAVSELAVRKDGNNLPFVPKDQWTPRLCALAVRTADVLHRVPVPWRSREICMDAVPKGRRAIFAVPDELRDEDMVALSLSRFPDLLDEMDSSWVTPGVLAKTRRRNPWIAKELTLEQMSLSDPYSPGHIGVSASSSGSLN